MNRQNLQNKEIDRVGSRLLKVTKPSNEEIERIVADPQLFDSITARIKADDQIDVQPKHSLLNWNRLKLPLLNRQMAIRTAAILTAFFVFAAMILITTQESGHIVEEKKITIEPKIQTKDFAISENPLQESKTDITEKDSLSKSAKRPNNKRIVSKKKSFKQLKSVRKKNSVKPQYASERRSIKPKPSKKQKVAIDKSPQVAKNEPQKVFYILPYSGNSEIGSGKVQIVSAKLSRSELFALGVNLQLENENSAIETELIIGDDGVARAIRVVEKY